MPEHNKHVVATPDLDKSPCSSFQEESGVGFGDGGGSRVCDASTVERSRLLTEMGHIEQCNNWLSWGVLHLSMGRLIA